MLIVTLAATCARPNGSDQTQAGPLALGDLNTLGWTDFSQLQSVDLLPPDVPEGVDEAEYDTVVRHLSAWAKGSLEANGVQGSQLDAEFVELLAELTDRGPSGLLIERTPFADGLQTSQVRGTAVWELVSESPLTLQLQTRVVWQLRNPAGAESLIAVVRTHGAAYQAGAWGLAGAWQEFGADDCALALDGVLRPGGEIASQTQDLRRFEAFAQTKELQGLEFADDEILDDAFLERCRTGRA